MAPSYMSSSTGDGRGCLVLANECSCAHGAQINFGDLTPYWTYTHAFLRSYDSAPRPPPPPTPVSRLDRRHTGRLRKRDNLLGGEGGWGGGHGAESHDRKKAWYSINYSILSVSRGTWSCAYHAEIWPQRPRLIGTGAWDVFIKTN
jgi:hypothetical protein